MTDYWKVLADLSYQGQILVNDQSLHGYHGSHDEDTEAATQEASALVVQTYF